MSPTINVNLKPCDCDGPHDVVVRDASVHTSDCASVPVLIPCPIPREVVLTVKIGGCDCLADDHLSHGRDCRSRPLRAVCAIGGNTWEEGEVNDVTLTRSEDYPQPDGWRAQFMAIARDRWALVKALVTDRTNDLSSHLQGALVRNAALLTQRNTVFAALADMAGAEDALYGRENDALKAIDGCSLMVPEPDNRPTAHTLARYMKHLLAQIGALP
jgi:hypothetical protein